MEFKGPQVKSEEIGEKALRLSHTNAITLRCGNNGETGNLSRKEKTGKYKGGRGKQGVRRKRLKQSAASLR